MSEQLAYSIDRNPIKAMLTAAEYAELARQVQYCEISWPVCIVVIPHVRTDDATPVRLSAAAPQEVQGGS